MLEYKTRLHVKILHTFVNILLRMLTVIKLL